jgi:hypothetical protein
MPNANLKSKIFFLCLCVSAFGLNCTAGATRAGENVGEKNRTYELKPGAEVAVEGADFTMLLGGVPEDSRCPQGVDCIWAGSVSAELVFCGPKAERSGRLNTNAAPRVLKYRGRYFRILKVSPPRVEGREIKPADYVVTLEVSRQAPAAQGADDVVELKDE